MNLIKEIVFEEGRMYEISSDFYVPSYTKTENKILSCHDFITNPNESKIVLFLKMVYLNGNHVIKLEPGKNRPEYIVCLYDSRKIYLPYWDLFRYCKIQIISDEIS